MFMGVFVFCEFFYKLYVFVASKVTLDKGRNNWHQ